MCGLFQIKGDRNTEVGLIIENQTERAKTGTDDCGLRRECKHPACLILKDLVRIPNFLFSLVATDTLLSTQLGCQEVPLVQQAGRIFQCGGDQVTSPLLARVHGVNSLKKSDLLGYLTLDKTCFQDKVVFL